MVLISGRVRRGGQHRGAVLGLVVVVGSVGLPLLCGLGGPAASAASDTSDTTVVRVAAAENFWGSIAAQLGGRHARVTSIITNPNTDPHDYEPTASDARLLAGSEMVVENGLGYDPWVPRLLAADQSSPTVLDVGHLLDLPDDANPHRWYNPADVTRVVNQMVADYQRLDPGDRSYFSARRARFERALAPYRAAIATIRARYRGTPVGASESIFALLAPALGLNLVTPPTFLRAISEGTDVSAADKQTIDRQISTHRIKIYVYNSQNVTPDVQAQLREVRAAHIPTATITETLAPARATYQAWQTRQLASIAAALARAAAPS